MDQLFASDISWLAVLAATVAAFMLGALWYGFLFQKPWLTEQQFSKEQEAEMNNASLQTKTYALTFVVLLAQAWLFSRLLAVFDVAAIGEAMIFGAFIGLIIAGGSLAVNFAYSFKTTRLFAIDAGYNVAYMALMCVVLAI